LKNIVLVVGLLFGLFVFTPLAHAADVSTAGLLRGVLSVEGLVGQNQFTDGKLDTYQYVGIGQNVTYAFSQPIDIDGYYVYSDASIAYIRLLDAEKKELFKANATYRNNNWVDIPTIKGVSYYIYTGNGGANKLYEIDLKAAPVPPPDAPNNLKTTSGDNSVTLTWDTPDGVVTGYKIWVDDQYKAQVSSLTNTYTVTGLADDTTYQFRVSAVGVNGIDSAMSDAVSGFAMAARKNPVLSFKDVASRSASISWTNGLRNTEIYVNGNKVGQTNGSTYTLTGLTPSTKHYVYVQMIDHYNRVLVSNTATVETRTVISTPRGLSGTAGHESVSLSWDQNKESYLYGYHVYQDGVRITPQPMQTTTYNISNLIVGREYRFAISAVDVLGEESVKSGEIRIKPIRTKKPDPINNLSVAAGNKSVKLFWSASKDPDLAGYFVYIDDVKVNNSPIKDIYFFANDLTNGQEYSFYVTAIDTYGNESLPSEIIKATPDQTLDNEPPAAPTGLRVVTSTESSITFAWNANTEEDLLGYFIYKDGKRINFYPVSETTYTVDDLILGETSRYTISAVDNAGNESAKSKEVVVRLTGNIPQGLQAQAGDEIVDLSWVKVTNATEYNVYRDNEKIATTTKTSFKDTGLKNGVVYSYQVSSVVDGTESGVSTPVVKARPGKFIDFPGDGSGTGGGSGSDGLTNPNDAIGTGFNFLKQFWVYVVVVLGVIFAPTIVAMLKWLFRWVKPKQQAAAQAETSDGQSSSERDRRSSDHRLTNTRGQKNEYLTRTNRIKERDGWFKQAEYRTKEERTKLANEENSRAGREQRAAATKSRNVRSTRAGRAARNGR